MADDRRLISSGSPFEARIGFSRAVRAGDVVVVSGTAPIGPDGATVGGADAGVQARRCLEIIESALKDAGASLADVVRTRIYLVRIQDWPLVAQVHGDVFADIRPACTVVQVGGFIDPSWLVELEVDAIVAPPKRTDSSSTGPPDP